MTLYITAVDEPIYLVPYLRRVIETCGVRVAGVAVVSARRRRTRIGQSVALALMALVIFSPAQLVRLAGYKLRELVASIGLGRTSHRLADVCRELSIPFRSIESANSAAFLSELKDAGVDVLLNQTPELLRAPVLKAPRIAVINRHLSLLPAYRGAWPIFWQCANNESTVGVTIHVVDEGLDTGEIVAQAPIVRERGERMPQLLERLFDRSVSLTCEALSSLERGAPRRANEGPTATYYRSPRPADLLRYLAGLPVRSQAI